MPGLGNQGIGGGGAGGTGSTGPTGPTGPAPAGTGIVTVAAGVLGTPGPLTGDTTTTGAGLVTTTVAINGSTVPAGGALTRGNVLQVTGAGALSYAPVNLAGGVNFVTGALPTANQVAQSLTLTGDVTSSSGTTASAATVCVAITGAAGSVPIASTGNVLTWAAATTAPGIAQTSTSSGNGATMSFIAQGATGAAHNGANLVLSSGTSGSATVGLLQLQVGGVTQSQLGQTSSDFLALGGPASGGASTQTAQAGYLRVPNNGAATVSVMALRNAGNTADLQIVQLGNTTIQFGNTTTFSTSLQGQQVVLNNSSGHTLTCSGTALTLSGLTSIAINGNGASAFTMSAAAVASPPALNIAAGASNTSGNNGATLSLQGGAAGGGAGLRGGVQLTLGTAGILVEVAEIVQNNRIVALGRTSAITSTQMPANSGDGVVYLANAATAPTASSVAGGILYCTAGALHFRGTSGTDTAIAPA